MAEKTEQKTLQRRVGLVAEAALEVFRRKPWSLHFFVFVEAALLAIKTRPFSSKEEIWIETRYKEYILRNRTLQ